MYEPSITANGLYRYNELYYGQTLCDIAEKTHEHLSNQCGWFYRKLVPGQFGYDNMIVSIGHLLDNYNENLSIDEMASLIHIGWIINYKYWRDNEPYIYNDHYKKSAKKLNDNKRNICAESTFNDLGLDDKNQNLIMVDVIKKILFDGN